MTKTSTSETPKNPEQEWFFSGGTEYVPMTVTATTYDEALKKWEKDRVPAQAPKPASTPAVDLQGKEGVE